MGCKDIKKADAIVGLLRREEEAAKWKRLEPKEGSSVGKHGHQVRALEREDSGAGLSSHGS